MITRTTRLALAALVLLPLAARAGGPTAAASPEARDEKARAYFTNTVLLDQAGKERRFYDDVLRGKVVAISFMFTRCEGACPLITQKLNAVRKELGDAFGSGVHFVSLSVDPKHDSPAALARFATAQRAVHPAWTFLTGQPNDQKRVLKKLGELSDDPGDHNTGLVVGNVRTGHWQKIRPDAPPAAIAEILRSLAGEAAASPVAAAAAR